MGLKETKEKYKIYIDDLEFRRDKKRTLYEPVELALIRYDEHLSRQSFLR